MNWGLGIELSRRVTFLPSNFNFSISELGVRCWVFPWKDSKDSKDPKDSIDPKDSKNLKNSKDSKDTKDSKDAKDSKDSLIIIQK